VSHNTVGIKVFVSNVVPVTFVQTGSQTLTITCDNNASEMTEVIIPSGLGTLESTTFTRTSATTSQIVCTLDIASVPASGTTNHTIALNTVGVPATGSVGYFSIAKTAFTPATLMVDPADTWIQASDASAVGDGNLVSSVTPGYGNRGALTQPATAERLVYRASVSELNGKPGLEGLKTTWTYANLQSATGYLFSPNATKFVVAICFVPSSGSTSHYFRSKNEGYSRSYNLTFRQNPVEEVQELYLGGSHKGDFAFPNTGTTSPRRVIMQGGSGSAVTLVEPVTGINISETPGTDTPSSADAYMLMIREGFIAEFIMITGRELTTAEKTNLNDYWIGRYGS